MLNVGTGDAPTRPCMAIAFFTIAIAAIAITSWPHAAYGAAEGSASEKSETVNVGIAADGATESVEVEALLRNDNAFQTLSDATTLVNVEGVDGATLAEGEAGMIWKAGGKNVAYKGKPTGELPIKIRVTYRLNGVEMSAADIAGKSGEVTIRYDYENTSFTEAVVDGSPERINTPFTCVTALMFNDDDFKHISVENGKVIDDDANVIVAGLAVPGLKASLGPLAAHADVPEYFEVTAITENFKLKPAMTVVTAGLMADFDADDLGIDDDDSAAGIEEAMSSIKGAAGELSGGLEELASGVDEASSGADALAYGASALASGAYLLAYGGDSTPGLDDMVDAAEQLSDGVNGAADALGDLADPEEGLPAASAALDSIAKAYPDEKEASQLLLAINASDLDESAKAQLSALIVSAPAVKQAAAGVSEGTAALTVLSSGFADLVAQVDNVPVAVGLAADAAANLYGASAELEGGASRMSSAMGDLAAGAHSAARGSDELAGGLEEFDREGLAKIVNTLEGDLAGFKKRLNAVSAAARAYDSFSGKDPSTPSSVTFVYEAAEIR